MWCLIAFFILRESRLIVVFIEITTSVSDGLCKVRKLTKEIQYIEKGDLKRAH